MFQVFSPQPFSVTPRAGQHYSLIIVFRLPDQPSSRFEDALCGSGRVPVSLQTLKKGWSQFQREALRATPCCGELSRKSSRVSEAGEGKKFGGQGPVEEALPLLHPPICPVEKKS